MRSPADAAKGDAKLKELFFFDMLAQGIWLARRGMFTLCLPIGDAECDRLAAAVEEFLSSRRSGCACYRRRPSDADPNQTTTKETSHKEKRMLTLRSRAVTSCLARLVPCSHPPSRAAATRGVSDSEIIIGCMADLSGVTAVQGVNNADGMRMAFDEVNAKGGVHGRKIRFIVEDMEYTVPKAVQAMNKLLNRDNIFFGRAMAAHPMNDAVMPAMFEKNVPNLFPTTCARSMYEPFNRLKFGQFCLVLRSDARRREALCRRRRA